MSLDDLGYQFPGGVFKGNFVRNEADVANSRVRTVLRGGDLSYEGFREFVSEYSASDISDDKLRGIFDEDRRLMGELETIIKGRGYDGVSDQNVKEIYFVDSLKEDLVVKKLSSYGFDSVVEDDVRAYLNKRVLLDDRVAALVSNNGIQGIEGSKLEGVLNGGFLTGNGLENAIYKDQVENDKHDFRVKFTFYDEQSGLVRAEGLDDFGSSILWGRYDAGTGEVYLIKEYKKDIVCDKKFGPGEVVTFTSIMYEGKVSVVDEKIVFDLKYHPNISVVPRDGPCSGVSILSRELNDDEKPTDFNSEEGRTEAVDIVDS